MYSSSTPLAPAIPSLSDPQETLKQLNTKFAGFIEKVHSLEERNSVMEAQIRGWMRRRAQKYRTCSDSEQQLRELTQSVYQSTATNGRLALLLERTQRQAAQLQARFDHSSFNNGSNLHLYSALHERYTLERSRQELLRAGIRSYRRRVNEELELESEELGNKTQRQRQELVALRQSQRQQVAALQPRWVPGTQPVSEEDETRGGMEVSQLLTDIRTHYTSLIQCTPAALSASSKVQLPDLTGVEMSNGDDSLRAARAELNDAKRQWHSLQVEMDSLQALEKGLESSLHATQQRYKLQLHGLESVITELETELQEVRRDIEHQVQEHQILLNTKMKLEWEIATYRSLLDREERRLCGNGPESSLTGFAQREIAVSSAAVLENHLEQKIETLTTREILGGNVVRQSAEARGKIQTEKVDEVIKEWEGSFFKDNPHLRKKSVSLRFDLHLAATDEGCSQTKQDSLPNIEVRLVMRKSSSIPSLKA